MAENGAVRLEPKKKSRSASTLARATKLTQLYQRHQDTEIVDEGGEVTPVRIKALDQAETEYVADILMTARERYLISMAKRRDEIVSAFTASRKEDLIRIIMNIEAPFAEQIADLAPNQKANTGPADPNKEETAQETWRERREKELVGLSQADLLELSIDRQFNLLISAKAAEEASDAAICMMMLNPENDENYWDMEEVVDGQANPFFLGRVSPKMKNELKRLRMDFVNMGSDKKVRETATSGPFLPPGESPAEPESTPGETTSIPSDSPFILEPSSAKDDG